MFNVPRDQLTQLVAIARTNKRCLALFIKMSEQPDLKSA